MADDVTWTVADTAVGFVQRSVHSRPSSWRRFQPQEQ
jgi:hypothetical protein